MCACVKITDCEAGSDSHFRRYCHIFFSARVFATMSCIGAGLAMILLLAPQFTMCCAASRQSDMTFRPSRCCDLTTLAVSWMTLVFASIAYVCGMLWLQRSRVVSPSAGVAVPLAAIGVICSLAGCLALCCIRHQRNKGQLFKTRSRR